MRRKSVGQSVPGSSKGRQRTISSSGHDEAPVRQPASCRATRASHPSERLRVVVVTGTSGKTTTAWLTASVLAEAGLRVGVLSDLGCLGLDDDLPIVADYSKPRSLALWLNRLADGGCTHAVVELSAEAIAAGVMTSLRVHTVVVTSVATPSVMPSPHDHDARAIATPSRTAKAAVAALHEDGCLVSGLPAASTRRLLRHAVGSVTCITAGITADCDLSATPVEAGLFGRMVLANCAGELLPLTLDTPVVPFVRDALLAVAVGGRYGIPFHVAARGLEAAGAVPGRMERVDRGQETAVFLDMPSTGHALSATLSSLRRLTRGRLAIIAEESFLDRVGADEFGPLVARHCDACVIVPPAVLDDDAGSTELAAYDRIDRLLGSLGTDDALLVLGDAKAGGDGPISAAAGRFSLVTLVDGWLQVAHGLPASSFRRAA